MKKIDDTREKAKVKKARECYLELAKVYAKNLSDASKLDPKVLTIAHEIANIGNNLAALDSKAVTDFYTKLLATSRIDRRYHGLVIETKKAKSALDIAAHKLFNAQVDLALASAGLPSKKHNLGIAKTADYINDKKTTLIEKIAYASSYIKEEILELSALAARGDVVIENGNIEGTTKSAKSYLRTLSKLIVERVNDHYFGPKSLDIKRIYVDSNNSGMGPLQLIAQLGDAEHRRELERRVADGDVVMRLGEIEALTVKGEKYLVLLSEELTAILDKNLGEQLVASNREALKKDDLINSIFEVVDEFEGRLAKHTQITSRYDFGGDYAGAVENYKENISDFVSDRQQIQQDIDRISEAALAIRKKLIILAGHNEVLVEDSLPVLTALNLLSKYEQQLDQRIAKLAARANLRLPNTHSAAASLSDILENHGNADDTGALAVLEYEISGILSSRTGTSDDLEATIRWVLGHSGNVQAYLVVTNELDALRAYLSSYVNNENRLYRGNEIVETVLSEIVEKEIERRELLSEIVHEVQLSHKQLWLANIRSGNNDYLDRNYSGEKLPLQQARAINTQIIKEIESEIADMVATFRSRHEAHAKKFLHTLSQLSAKVAAGQDVSTIGAELRREYREMEKAHREDLSRLELEMKRLDRQLVMLPEKSRKAIEKSLISDIKKRVIS